MIPEQILGALAGHRLNGSDGGLRVLEHQQLGGGSINRVFRILTESGEFCIKYNHSREFPRMFEAEAAGLRLLNEGKAIKVPGVILHETLPDYSYILLEFIHPAAKVKDFYGDFGRSLARLHRNGNDLYGLDFNNYMGSLPQSNIYHTGWVDFFTEERLDKQLRLAMHKGLLDGAGERMFESLFMKLPELLPEEPPCLVHGDLWSGNFIVSGEGKACLIDPAVYYGNREIDLAMSSLFGGFDAVFYEAYEEEFPLIPGWRDRLDLYNLYPLMVHLNLFGRGYLGSILSILRRF